MKSKVREFFKTRKNAFIGTMVLVSFIGINVGWTLVYAKDFISVSSGIYETKAPYDDVIYYNYESKPANWPNLSAQAAVLVEVMTGTIIYAKNEHQKRDPASITKIMTALIALERCELSEIVTISSKASNTKGSSIGARTGEEHKLEELIRSTMLKSGNDGAMAIAEHVAGSEEQFIKLMNVRAASMGLKNTVFLNPHGLTKDGHTSSAYDLAVLSLTALSNEKFSEIVSTKEMWYSDDDSSEWFKNTNKLLWSLEGADGVKTGTTDRAGSCLSASATRDGMQFVAVVLNASGRWNDAAELLEFGFSEFSLVELAKANEVVAEFSVDGNPEITVSGILTKDLSVVVKNSDAVDLKVTIEAEERIKLPVEKGQTLGYAVVSCKGQEILRLPIYAEADMKKKGLFS